MFADKTAFITGAASGIGLAAAHHLAGHGAARLILNDRDGERLAAATAALDGPRLLLRLGDIAEERYWAGLQPDLADVDVAFLNAGVLAIGAIADLDFAEWRRVLSINLDGTFLGLRAVMRAMQTHCRGGAIVLTASVTGLKAGADRVAYAASKAAVLHLARVAAIEGAPHGIRVNAIAPGGVETPIWQEMPFFQAMTARTGSEGAAYAEMAKAAIPLGRYAKPEEIAAQVAFLLSDACATVTGTTFVSDCG